MKKTSTHHYLALAVSLFIFLVSVSAYLFIYYRVEAESVSTAQAFTRVAIAQNEKIQASKAVAVLASTQNERHLLTTFFAQSNQTVSFIEKVEAVGMESGSQVTLVSIGADDLTSALASATGWIKTHVEIRGSWSSAMRALHLLENLPYVENTNNLRLNPQEKKTWNIELDLAVLLVK